LPVRPSGIRQWPEKVEDGPNSQVLANRAYVPKCWVIEGGEEERKASVVEKPEVGFDRKIDDNS
jgi:hypothetical protein